MSVAAAQPWRYSVPVALLCAASSAQVIAKYLHSSWQRTLAHLLCVTAVASAPYIARWLAGIADWLIIILFAMFFLEALVVYPKADARKQINAGSDADDALIQASDALRGFKYPYENRTYLGNPISAGPGWAILDIPASALHLYALQTPILLAGFAYFLYRRSREAGLLFSGVLAATPVLHEITAVGLDLALLSGALSLMVYSMREKESSPRSAMWAFLGGLVWTARINMIVVPVALQWMRFGVFSRRRLGVTAASLALAIGLHGAFYFAHPSQYMPIHLLGKTKIYLGLVPVLAPLLTAAGVAFVLRFRAKNSSQLFAGLAIMLLFMHLPLAIGCLKSAGYDFARWEGFEYISVSLVPAAAALALRGTE